MKFSAVLCLGVATTVVARTVPADGLQEKFLIKTSEHDEQWVTQEEKWALRREGKNFMDKTFTRSFGNKAVIAAKNYSYPKEASHKSEVEPLFKTLSTESMKTHLTKFSSFNNRYYKSDTGKQSSAWLLSQVKDIITKSGAKGASVAPFPHPKWTQDSIIATIPGKSKNTVVLGSHQDSINHKAANPATARAPGADDNGSGSMTILESLNAYLQDPKVKAGEAANTVEFHWYAAEEEGLLGSQAVFEQYEKDGRAVVAMLAQDMTGYTKGTVDAGEPISVGIITDFVNKDLTAFLKVMIDAYCTIPYVESKCGYACSDHASATDAGYASSFVFESKMGNDSPYIHSAQDTLDTIDYDHMLEHAKMSLGFAYELGFTEF